MNQNYFATKEGKTALKAMCIVASYIVMYGIFALLVGLIENNSFAFIIFLIVCIFFTYKSCKGMLVDKLSSLPWPIFIVLIILLSGVIGCFTAPYHIGKWIAEKISKNISSSPNKSNVNRNSTNPTHVQHCSEYDRIFKNINNMNEQELDKIHETLLSYVNEIPMPAVLPGTGISGSDAFINYEEFSKRTIKGGPIYGCRTYGEAEKMNKAIVNRLDALCK